MSPMLAGSPAIPQHAVRRPGGGEEQIGSRAACPSVPSATRPGAIPQTIVIGAEGNIASDCICALTACGKTSFNAA